SRRDRRDRWRLPAPARRRRRKPSREPNRRHRRAGSCSCELRCRIEATLQILPSRSVHLEFGLTARIGTRAGLARLVELQNAARRLDLELAELALAVMELARR